MGKHERPTEKNILIRACEVADAIRDLEADGVVGIYPFSGIALRADVFMKYFKDYDAKPADNGTFVTTIYRGQQFCSFITEDNNG